MQTRGRQSSIENGQMGTRLPNLVTDESSEDGDAFQEPPELPEEGPAVEGGSFIRRPVTNDPNQTLIERVTVGVPGDGVERQKAADKSYEGGQASDAAPVTPPYSGTANFTSTPHRYRTGGDQGSSWGGS